MTAYEHGLTIATEEAVSAVVYAVEVGLLVSKTLLSIECDRLAVLFRELVL